MACSAPISGWLSRRVNPSGRRSVVFRLRDGYVDKPVQLPCGRCLGCRADQSLMWSIRAYHESSLHERNCFVTLTYADEHLPADGRIVKADLQNFFKRLRWGIAPAKLRYLACGEYGELTRRPHYHALIFGQDFLHDRIPISGRLYTSPTVSEAWPYGHISIGSVTMSSCCYVAGYVVKKINDTDTFMLASRRPGIGHDWIDRYYDDLRRTRSVVIEGREYPIPARYLDWHTDALAEVKLSRRRHMERYNKDVDPMERRRRDDAKHVNRSSALSRRSETL